MKKLLTTLVATIALCTQIAFADICHCWQVTPTATYELIIWSVDGSDCCADDEIVALKATYYWTGYTFLLISEEGIMSGQNYCCPAT